MARVLLLYDEVEPALLEEEAWPSSDATEPKKRRRLQVLFVRIRTRMRDVPRTGLVEVPAEEFKELRRYGDIWFENGEYGELRSGRTPVDCRNYIMERAPESSLAEWASLQHNTYDPAEWETGTKFLRLCLIPHFDYSFDMNTTISLGEDLEQEQALIIAYVL